MGDYFKNKAGSYETVSHRVNNVRNIAAAILASTELSGDMELLDFGSGTGLLLERVAPSVKKITALDISVAMNQQLDAKRSRIDCELDIVTLDLTQSNCPQKFDGIISSMTMHHIEDVEAVLVKFYSMLEEGGFIAIADLVTEDGSFHAEDTGVFHAGFDPEKFRKLAKCAGFKLVACRQVSVVKKPQGDYPVFLLTARK